MLADAIAVLFIIALIFGAILALVALWFILEPLTRGWFDRLAGRFLYGLSDRWRRLFRRRRRS